MKTRIFIFEVEFVRTGKRFPETCKVEAAGWIKAKRYTEKEFKNNKPLPYFHIKSESLKV